MRKFLKFHVTFPCCAPSRRSFRFHIHISCGRARMRKKNLTWNEKHKSAKPLRRHHCVISVRILWGDSRSLATLDKIFNFSLVALVDFLHAPCANIAITFSWNARRVLFFRACKWFFSGDRPRVTDVNVPTLRLFALVARRVRNAIKSKYKQNNRWIYVTVATTI